MIFSFVFIYIFVVNIVYYVVHIVCQVDVIANSLVLYLPFCSTLNKKCLLFSLSSHSNSIFSIGLIDRGIVHDRVVSSAYIIKLNNRLA